MNIKDVRAQYPEYNDMSDADLARAMHGKFYSDMPFDEFAGKVGLTQAQEAKPAMSWGDALREGAGNIPSSSVRLAGDLWKSITSPVETAKAIGNTALGYGQKAVGVDGEATKYADAMNAYFKDRYGSEEGFKQAVAQDPAGVMADISTVFTGVGGALKGGAIVAAKAGAAGRALEAAQTAGKVASAVGAYTDPLSLALKASPVVTAPASKVKSLILAGQPLEEKLMASAIKPSTTLPPAERNTIIRTALQERILPNQAGYEKLQGLMGDQRGVIKTMIEDASPTELDAQKIVDAARQSNWEGVYANTASPSASQRAAERVFSDFESTYGDKLSLQKAQEVKTKTNAVLNEENKYGVLSGAKGEAQKAIIKALKEEIEAAVPGISEENARLGALMALDNNQIERAIARSQNNNMFGLTAGQLASAKLASAGAVGGGLLGGIPGVVLGGLAGKAISEPANAARAALAVDALKRRSAQVGGLLDKLPDSLNRRSLTYPAYVDRMREEAN